MDKKLELKIYEILGIKTFKKLVTKIPEIIIFLSNMRKTKEERKMILKSHPGNYFIKKPYNLENIKDFKFELFTNTMLHLSLLIPCICMIMASPTNLVNTIFLILAILVNIYCIMLQRYNHLRINEVLKKLEVFEEKKKNLEKLKSLAQDKSINLVEEKEIIETTTSIQFQEDILANFPAEEIKLKRSLKRNNKKKKRK